MDRTGNSPDAVAGALRDIRLVNRFLGGRRALLKAIDPFLGEAGGGSPPAALEVLDVGTGGADLALDMVEHARRRRFRIRVTAIDSDPAAVAFAAREAAGSPEIRVIQADASRLPFRDRSFDLVTASMFLHHFDPPSMVRLLESFRRLARRAVLVNDLRRHNLAWALIGVAARITRRSRMFAHDAPLSVLRGFTGTELLDAALAAGAKGARLDRRWPYRLVLTVPAAETPA
jgi:SAM-dependent methyltransferase